MFGVEKYFPRNVNPRNWFFEKAYYDFTHSSLSCCSDIPTGFHYVKNIKEMFTLMFLTYQVHPFAVDKSADEKLPKKLLLAEILNAADVPSNSSIFVEHKIFHNMESSEIF